MRDRKASEGGAPAPSSFSRPVELLFYGVSPLATLVTAPILARSLGPEARGQYGVAIAVSIFALTLSAWGQAETYLAEARAGRVGYSQQTRIALVGGLLTTVAAVFALLLLGLPLLTAVLTALWIPILNQTSLWRAVSVASGRLKPPALSSVLGPLLRMLGLVVLGLLAVLDVNSAITVSQAALALAALGTVALAARTVQRGATEAVVPVRVLLGSGAGVITFDVFNALALRSDLIVLQLFGTPKEVGLYAAPVGLIGAAIGVGLSVKARMQAAAVQADSSRTLRREATVVLALGVVGAAVLWFLAPTLVTVFFGPGYEGSVSLLRLLGIAAIPLVMVDLAQGVLVVIARRRSLILVGACNATVVVGLLAVLCPTGGATGAALAVLIGYTVAAAVGWTVVTRTLRGGSRTAAPQAG